MGPSLTLRSAHLPRNTPVTGSKSPPACCIQAAVKACMTRPVEAHSWLWGCPNPTGDRRVRKARAHAQVRPQRQMWPQPGSINSARVPGRGVPELSTSHSGTVLFGAEAQRKEDSGREPAEWVRAGHRCVWAHGLWGDGKGGGQRGEDRHRGHWACGLAVCPCAQERAAGQWEDPNVGATRVHSWSRAEVQASTHSSTVAQGLCTSLGL